MEQILAVILAAGRSERLGTVDKLWVTLGGKPLIQWSIEAFNLSEEISGITVVTREESLERLLALVSTLHLDKPCDVVLGGSTRMESVSKAAMKSDAKYIAVHDAARPCIQTERINAVCNAARGIHCACLSLPVVETLVRVESQRETNRIDRNYLFALQTPQVICRETWIAGKERAEALRIDVTDDTHMATLLDLPVTHVMGNRNNIKVTYVEDIRVAENIMKESPRIEYRTGFGYDIHRTSPNRPCILGGIHFSDSPLGLMGHSDADVLLHAICDALLGAASLGDIGVHFPPSDTRHQDRPSIEFLQEVNNLLITQGWNIGNIDATVIAEEPKIMSRSHEMCKLISSTLNLTVDRISVKATTNEGLGAIGSRDGIAAHAVATVYK